LVEPKRFQDRCEKQEEGGLVRKGKTISEGYGQVVAMYGKKR